MASRVHAERQKRWRCPWEGLAGAGARGFGHAGLVLVHVALSRSSRSNLWFAPCGHNLSLLCYHLKSSLSRVSGVVRRCWLVCMLCYG